VPHHQLGSHIIKIVGGPKIYVDFHNRGTKKLALEIGGLKVQKYQNRGTKTAFKPNMFYLSTINLKIFGRNEREREREREREMYCSHH
jgi:hypothetical protein